MIPVLAVPMTLATLVCLANSCHSAHRSRTTQQRSRHARPSPAFVLAGRTLRGVIGTLFLSVCIWCATRLVPREITARALAIVPTGVSAGQSSASRSPRLLGPPSVGKQQRQRSRGAS
jgi:hypothetical protein